ncbi:hypothetical protein [Bradyrhizobium roseum]|uniref:hypothetical protein n=1 Tax=Bradyrhizobium roseum TaxID=3056648 RepID=UPI002623965A|nr:hypothetical protein [Bradyrhizobium roseus]WKA25798.1 hypothetical protein QUH67_19410 [Bradyrhizobium roseus]
MKAVIAKKGLATPLPVVLAVMSGIASVRAANDPAAQPRACSMVDKAGQLQCLDRRSRAPAPPLQLALAGDGWIVSETTSPVDYSPIATATTSSRKVADASEMRLTIRCRGERTELVVEGPAITDRGDNYFISYRVNGGPSVQLAGAAPAFGDGVAFKGDVVALLQSLPNDGELVVRLFPLSGSALDGIFALEGLEALRGRIGATCKWPRAIAKPNNRQSR